MQREWLFTPCFVLSAGKYNDFYLQLFTKVISAMLELELTQAQEQELGTKMKKKANRYTTLTDRNVLIDCRTQLPPNQRTKRIEHWCQLRLSSGQHRNCVGQTPRPRPQISQSAAEGSPDFSQS